jgi:hypothetical protein
MSRSKGRRPGTRGNNSKVLPEDLPDAAEAALDDLLRGSAAQIEDDEPRTSSHAISEARVVDLRSRSTIGPIDEADGDEEPQTMTSEHSDDSLALTGKRRLPPPVAPLTPPPSLTMTRPNVPSSPRTGPGSSLPRPGTPISYGPLPSDSPLPSPTARSTPLPSPNNPLSSPVTRSSPLPSRLAAPERNTPSSSGRIAFPLPPRDTGAVPVVASRSTPVDPYAIDTSAVPLIDTGLVPLADDEDSDDDLGIDDVPIDTDGDDDDDSEVADVIEQLELTNARRALELRTRPGRGDSAFDDLAVARAASAPYDDIAFARAASAAPVDDDQLVDERSAAAIPALRFAIYEESSHLGSAQSAVSASGHDIEIGGSGRDGLARVLEEVRSGEIDAVLVAVPGGEPIIEAALALERRPIVIASCGGTIHDAIQRALAIGADLATTRPHDVERIAPLALAAARLQLERGIAAAARGSGGRLDDNADTEPRSFLPFEVFQRVLDLEIKRAKKFEYPLAVAMFAVEVDPPAPPPGIRGILRARAGNALINATRDIDFATQVEGEGGPGNERFLVLLPYTDLKGAAGVARRLIAAVATGGAVTAAGRSFPPRVVGAVAGMRPGEGSSVAKLMKDATRTLEQARREGAELAVQP